MNWGWPTEAGAPWEFLFVNIRIWEIIKVLIYFDKISQRLKYGLIMMVNGNSTSDVDSIHFRVNYAPFHNSINWAVSGLCLGCSTIYQWLRYRMEAIEIRSAGFPGQVTLWQVAWFNYFGNLLLWGLLNAADSSVLWAFIDQKTMPLLLRPSTIGPLWFFPPPSPSVSLVNRLGTHFSLWLSLPVWHDH